MKPLTSERRKRRAKDQSLKQTPAKHMRAEEVLGQKLLELGERLKELNCLYAFSNLLDRPGLSLPEIFQGFVEILPPAWQYPEITCARLVLDDQCYSTSNFRETPWKQSAPVFWHETQLGILDVYYLEEKPECSEGPFLKEERALINALTERLGKTIERKRAEEALQRAHDELEQRVKERTSKLRMANEQLQREIGERKRSQKNLELERSKLKGILGAMNTGVYIVNRDHDIEYINSALEKEFGPVHGRKCYEYFHDFSESCSWCKNQDVFAGKSVQWELYFFKTRRTHELFDTPIKNEDGTVSILVIFHDITERKRTEDLLKESENRLRHLSSQLLTVQENERRRVARELHDGIGQMLASIKFKVEDTLHRSQRGRVEEKPLATIISLLKESIEEVRRIQMDLRPPILDDLGILATMGWLIREFQKIYSRIRIEKQTCLNEEEIPNPLKTVIFRIIQEALNNIAKHSHADLVLLSLKKIEGQIELMIEDNGRGFAPESSTKGLGLTNMRERTELSGGSFALESVPGKGTLVRARWPSRTD